MKKDIILSPSLGDFQHTVFIKTGDVITEKKITMEQLPDLMLAHPGYTVHLFGNEDFLRKYEEKLKEKNVKFAETQIKILYNK